MKQIRGNCSWQKLDGLVENNLTEEQDFSILQLPPLPAMHEVQTGTYESLSEDFMKVNAAFPDE